MSPDTQTHVNTARALGRVESTLTAVQKTLSDLTSALEADRKEAAAGREVINASLQAVTADVSDLRADMDEVKPMSEQLKRWQLVGLGAVLTVGAIASALGGLAVYFKEYLHRTFWSP